MYRSCIFCSANLGSNEAVEEFPVGRSLAFDAWKGRLWAVCPKCGRWNLAPIEERWEAVEQAEKLFRDSRLRVQSENIGLAKLRDGTKLIRVGEALPGELAAWRYGDTLVSRRKQYLLYTGVAIAGAVALSGGLWAVGAVGAVSSFTTVGNLLWMQRMAEKVVGRVPGESSSTGRAFEVHRRQLDGARLVRDEAGEPALYLPEGLTPRSTARQQTSVPLTLYGETARQLLGRSMTIANQRGAGRKQVDGALRQLESAGSADELVRRVAGQGVPIGIAPTGARGRAARQYRAELKALAAPERLALEMALHEQQERTALEGELSGLEAAWRQAEEIAAIADALPGPPAARTLP